MLRRPSVVLEMIGNSATSAAHTIIAAVGFLTQMMMSGATATMGVTCSSTAYGNSAVSIALALHEQEGDQHADHRRHHERQQRDLQRDQQRPARAARQSVTSVCIIRKGDGTRYGGSSRPVTRPCQIATSTTPTSSG